jgi:hypothetical protein
MPNSLQRIGVSPKAMKERGAARRHERLPPTTDIVAAKARKQKSKTGRSVLSDHILRILLKLGAKKW